MYKGNPNIVKEGENTRFSSANQPKNRGRKGKSVSEFLRDFGQANSVEYEIKVTKGGQTKTKNGKIESKTTLNEVVAITLLSKAMNGDLRAIDIVLDRIEGKSKQSLEVEVTQLPEMTREQRLRKIKELIEKAKKLNENNE